MSEKRPFKIYKEPELQSSSLVVGWSEDAGRLGSGVIDYLNNKLGGEEFAEIEPVDFFALGGVSVEDDVAQFPESKFYCCQKKSLLLFKGDWPRHEWHKFLNYILDVAEYCNVKELYTIGGMVTLGAHTAPRELRGVANSPEMKEILSHYRLDTDMNYQTPPGQRPTLSSFLLWVAKGRDIPGTSLWVPIPLYLVATEDPQSWKKTIEFLNNRLGLEIDFSDLDQKITRHNEKIAHLRERSPDIDKFIRRLENNLGLSREETESLAKEVEQFLREGD